MFFNLNDFDLIHLNEIRRATDEEVIQKAKDAYAAHGRNVDYDYLSVERKTRNETSKKVLAYVNMYCKKHDKYFSKPLLDIQKSGDGCEDCNNENKSDVAKDSKEEIEEKVLNKAKELNVSNRYIFGNITFKSIGNDTSNRAHIEVTCKLHPELGTVPKPVNGILNYGQFCKKCGNINKIVNRRKSNEDYIDEITEIFEKQGKSNIYSVNRISRVVRHYTNKTCYRPYVFLFCKKHNCTSLVSVNSIISRNAGCPICSESKGEKLINGWLRKHDIKFEPQKKFTGLLDVGQLSYDFYIPSLNLLIEYNGKQHYNAIEYFGGKKSFAKQCKHDLAKINYAKNNKYILLTIPYTKEKEIDSILTDWIIDKKMTPIEQPKIIVPN